MSQVALTRDEVSVWTWLVSKGIANALSGLSQMVGQKFDVTSIDLKQFPVKDTAARINGSQHHIAGSCLEIEGDATGYMLLTHEAEVAFNLIDMLLGQPAGSTRQIGEMERSVLGEMGNITGSFFLNALADTASLLLMPSPPQVREGTLAEIMDAPLTFLMKTQDDALVIKATFSSDNRQTGGTFIVLPTIEFVKAVIQHSTAQSIPPPVLSAAT